MATEITSRISISKKILLVSLTFSLPIAVLGYLVVSNIDENSRIAALEASGNAYQTPLEWLLRDTLEHQRLARHCPANTDCKAQMVQLQDGVSKGLVALAAVDAKFGTQLEFTTEGLAKRNRQLATGDNLAKTWHDIVDALDKSQGQSTPDIDAKYADVNGIINTMITHLGDTSTLILDPVLDTYYTMDITLLALPQNQNRISRMIADAITAFSHEAFTAEDRMTFAANAALLQTSDIDRVNADVQTALNENKNDFHDAVASFQEKLPAGAKEWTDANVKLVAMTKDLATAATPAVTLDEYIDTAVKAQQSAFKFWDTAARENDNLFQMRVDFYNNRRNFSLLMAAIALLFSGFIAYLVTRSMIVPLNKLTLTLKPGATLLAGSVQQISEASKKGAHDAATTAIICEELTAHADDMRNTAQNLEILVFGHAIKQS
ncbi:MAG: hypothetical protein SGJ03_17045 [Alphaproteobacteria bacterium]|nr:hypothetical protein [Alphaproteobacteria bacterium]